MERYESAAASSVDAQEGLERLLFHLDDELVAVESLQLPDLGRCRLGVFRSRGGAMPSDLFSIVTSFGQASVGLADPLTPAPRREWLQLGAFDQLQEEVVAVPVTAAHRPVGSALDLYLLTRPLRPSEAAARARVYHGIVRTDSEAPRLEPAVDDSGEPRPTTWKGRSPEALPQFLLRTNRLSLSPQADAFELSSAAGGWPPHFDSCRAVAVSREVVVGVDDRSLLLWPADASGGEPTVVARDLPLDQPSGLAIAVGRSGEVFVVHAGDDRQLRGFRIGSQAGVPPRVLAEWRQQLFDLTADCVLLTPTSPEAWPDVLVAYYSGHLERLRLVGTQRLRDAWRHVVAANHLVPEAGHPAAARHGSAQQGDAWRRAALFAKLEGLLDCYRRSRKPASQRQLAARVVDLFDKDEDHRVLTAALDGLLGYLRRPDAAGDDHLWLALREIRRRHNVSQEICTQIDRVVRSLDHASFSGRSYASTVSDLVGAGELNREAAWDKLIAEPNPTPGQRKERAVLGLERWASALLPCDSLRLSRSRERPITGAAAVEFRGAGAEGQCIAIAMPGSLQLHALGMFGRIDPASRTTFPIAGGELLVEAVPADGDAGPGVVAASSSGRVFLIRFGADATPEESTTAETRIPNCLGVHALRCLVRKQALPLVIAAYRTPDGAALACWSVEGKALRPLQRWLLDLRGVRSIDVAEDSGRVLVLVTPTQGPVVLMQAAMEGGLDEIDRISPSTGDTLVGRLSSSQSPTAALLGGRAGYLWSVSLKPTPPSARLRWLHKLDTAVRCMETLTLDGEPVIAAGSDAGRLALLRAADGARIWTHRMRSPVRGLVTLAQWNGGGPGLAVLMRHDWLSIFRAPADRAGALQRVLDDLEAADANEQTKVQSADNKTLMAIRDIAAGNLPKAKVIAAIRGRERRARLIRFLGDRVLSKQRVDIEPILAKLTFRELHLLCWYLPLDTLVRDEQLREGLDRHAFTQERGDDSPQAAMVAAVSFLHRLDRRRLDPGRLVSALPRREIGWASEWFRLELARILLQAVVRHSAGAVADGDLFASTLPLLLDLQPALVSACRRVLAAGSTDLEQFKAAEELLTVLSGSAGLTDELLDRLAFLDRPSTPHLGVLPRLVDLARVYLRWRSTEHVREDRDDREPDSWRLERQDALAAIARLSAATHAEEGDAPNLFVRHLRNTLGLLLPLTAPPPDTDTQSSRFRWLNDARDRVVTATAPVREAEPPTAQADWADGLGAAVSWQQLLVHGFEELKQALTQLLDREYRHLLTEVRPFLRLLPPIEVDDVRRATLHLEVHYEGRKPLSTVTVRIDAAGMQGLLPPSNAVQVLSFARFNQDSVPRPIDLTGTLPPGAESVTITVEFLATGERKQRQEWRFPVPQMLLAPTARPLAVAVSRALDQLERMKGSVVVLVVDRILGRSELLARWRGTEERRKVDLDAALSRTGTGRWYGASPLDLEALLAPLALDQPATNGILVEPADQTVQRLLDNEVEGLLEAWAGWVLEHRRRTRSPRIFLVLPGHQAASLRRVGFGELPTVRAHSMLQSYSGHALKRTPEIDALVSLVRDQTRLPPAACHEIVFGLGGDAHYLAEWLHWVSAEPDRAHDFVAALKSQRIEQRLRAELASGSPLDVLHAIVGAYAVTNLPVRRAQPGMIAAADFFSTTRTRAPKRVQSPGLPLTDRALEALRSDVSRPAMVRIEGFSDEGTPEEGGDLLEISRNTPPAQRRSSFERLTRFGVGRSELDVFRTAEPYRTYLRSIVPPGGGHTVGEQERIYRALLGTNRVPLEALSLSELSLLPQELQRRLLPRLSTDDLRHFRRLGQLWRQEPLVRFEEVFNHLFSAPTRLVFETPERETRWDSALAALPYPKLGLGLALFDDHEKYPVGYHFWMAPGTRVDFAYFYEALEQTRKKSLRMRRAAKPAKEKELTEDLPWTPRVVLHGPAVDGLAPDPQRRVAILRGADVCFAAWQGGLAEALLRRARSQLRLTAISPFQTGNPLPAGSRLFFGREDELAFVRANLRRSSIFVVGARKVGKTSFLNRILAWAKDEQDLAPIFVDLQAARNAKAVADAIRYGFDDPDVRPEVREVAAMEGGLEQQTRALRARGLLPVLLINEVDGVARRREIVGGWRRLSELDQARFVLTAYTAVTELGNPKSQFFNWTVGDSFDRRAIAPTALSVQAAEDLIDLLTKGELELRWADEEQQRRGVRALLDRSYRIPWVLQYFGHQLLRHLEANAESDLTLDAVNAVLDLHENVVWDHIFNLDYQSLARGGPRAGRRPGYRLVLFCLARQRYLLGGSQAPIRDSRLSERSPLADGLGFTVGEAREIVKSTVAQLLLDQEEVIVGRWFDQLDLEHALNLLTLTLTVEPDTGQSGRYGFLMHILPRELYRLFGRTDPTLDTLIAGTATELLRFMDIKKEGASV